MAKITYQNGWVKLTGDLLSPGTFIIGDSNLRPILENPGRFMGPKTMVTMVPGGGTAAVVKLLGNAGMIRTLENIETFIVCGLGANNLCKKGPKGVDGVPSQLPGMSGHNLKLQCEAMELERIRTPGAMSHTEAPIAALFSQSECQSTLKDEQEKEPEIMILRQIATKIPTTSPIDSSYCNKTDKLRIINDIIYLLTENKKTGEAGGKSSHTKKPH